jgi:hypothetical protein
VEQSVLAQTCPDDRHTAVFAHYNMIALLAGALGGLAAAGLSTLTWWSWATSRWVSTPDSR